MITIQTREKNNGLGWWCNGTINGYDVSFEHEERLEAVRFMISYLKGKGIDPFDKEKIKWERVLYRNSTFGKNSMHI